MDGRVVRDTGRAELCLRLGGVGRREPWWVFLEGTRMGSGCLYKAELGEVTGPVIGNA